VDPRRKPGDSIDEFHERAELVARVGERLKRDSFPRLAVFTIVLVAGGCAFLFSALTLAAGLDSMALRYGLAAVIGYLSFGVLIRGWIAMRKREFDLTSDFPVPDFELGKTGRSAGDIPQLFTGGKSGGGGSTGSWADGAGEARAFTPIPLGGSSDDRSGDGDGLSGILGPSEILESEDGWKIVLAAVLILGAVVAAGFVVYWAPTLLAEVALDAGVMTTVYRRMRRQDAGHWTSAVLRRTWVPALIITAFMTGAGFLLQQVAPEARSIGGVVRALRAS
jgi:hypothetical protein